MQELAIQTVELTAEQQRKWDAVSSMLAWRCPGFQHIWYTCLNAANGKYTAVMSRDVCDTAATDGKNVILNPDGFFQFNVAGCVYISVHEILHVIFGDVEFMHQCHETGLVPMEDGTALPFEEDVMQKILDWRNNAILDKNGIGARPQKDGKDYGHFRDDLTGDESRLDLYRMGYEEKQKDPNGGQGKPDPNGKPGQGQGKGNPGGFDQVVKPGQSMGNNPGSAVQDRKDNAQKWLTALAAAQSLEEQARQQGAMPAGLKRLFQHLLEPEVSWIEHIETLINRVGGSGGFNWEQPDEWWTPHDFYQPQPTGRGAGWVMIWGDTSGSRGDIELSSNIAELAGILEDVNPARLTVAWCDAGIDFVDEITDPADLETIKARGTGGGGGTSMHPVFDWIASQGSMPDLFIGFTDGAVTFPSQPSFPVIWASSTDARYPYGDVVRVLKKGGAR